MSTDACCFRRRGRDVSFLVDAVGLVAMLFAAVFSLCACEPVDDTVPTGTTGELGTTSSGSGSGDDAVFLIEPDVPDVEEGRSGWYNVDCFTLEDDFESCAAWCGDAGFGECLTVETYLGECLPRLEGTQVVGWCHRDPFEEWPADTVEQLHLRCVCRGVGE